MQPGCVPSGCQCDCHKPGMTVSHVVACCFASGMTVEVRAEWRCELCGTQFDNEAVAWEHWMNCSEQPAIWNTKAT